MPKADATTDKRLYRSCASSQHMVRLNPKIRASPNGSNHDSARSLAVIAILASVAACKMSHEDVRADSVQTAEQMKLTNQLAAQKDSLMTVVLDADKFIYADR